MRQKEKILTVTFKRKSMEIITSFLFGSVIGIDGNSSSFNFPNERYRKWERIWAKR